MKCKQCAAAGKDVEMTADFGLIADGGDWPPYTTPIWVCPDGHEVERIEPDSSADL